MYLCRQRITVNMSPDNICRCRNSILCTVLLQLSSEATQSCASCHWCSHSTHHCKKALLLKGNSPQLNPTQPTPTQPNPTQPNPAQHNTIQLNPTQPNPTEHNLAQHNPTQPNTTQPDPTQPNPTQLNPTQLSASSLLQPHEKDSTAFL